MKKIRKILIANRGEIAVRIIRAARESGILSVAIFSEIDKSSLHVQMADECYLLEKYDRQPYLDIDQITRIGLKAKVDAVHPGYGFLSENAKFARKISESGLIFIGPSHETIHTMGDKLQAKELAVKAGVPVIPGFQVENPEDIDFVLSQSEIIGFPVLIKARAGGGGKGMRLVNSSSDLKESIQRAVSEALDAFGDGSIFMEKYIEEPRHIEIQVLADQHGNVVHLFERECSIQRRHQKVIEEAPSAVVSEALRENMGNCAVSLAKACGYVNAGTIEFVVDQSGDFYFLEMNTRLQVEHPVTEYVTGIDLVKQQFRIAEGEKLDFSQNNLKIIGHAIELRVYAEDPMNNFLPDIGRLARYRAPKGIGVRVDDGYEEGMEIPVEYDPLIAKLVVFGENRAVAISRMQRAISEYQIVGVKNTLGFGMKVMKDRDFREGNFSTDFISQKSEQLMTDEEKEDEMVAASVLAHEVFAKVTSKKFKNLSNCQSNWRGRLKE